MSKLTDEQKAEIREIVRQELALRFDAPAEREKSSDEFPYVWVLALRFTRRFVDEYPNLFHSSEGLIDLIKSLACS